MPLFRLGVAALALSVAASTCLSAEPARASGKRIPVILDADIGTDIDDTWALAFLLKRPEFDVKLVVGDYGNVDYRAKLFAKFLQVVGRSTIPIGLGMETPTKDPLNQEAWLGDYRLESYPGRIHRDGVKAMIDMIMQSPEPVTLLSIGPMPNVAEALKREPRIAQRARLVGMYGAVRMGYGGNKKVTPEWNVRAAPLALRDAFAAPWDITITPLDTCGLVTLKGAKYRRVLESTDPVAKALVENYRAWAAHGKRKINPDIESSVLFDTVAVYLAYAEALTTIERLPLEVSSDGMTKIAPGQREIRVATAWKNLAAFEDLLVESLQP